MNINVSGVNEECVTVSVEICRMGRTEPSYMFEMLIGYTNCDKIG